jgi:hypothetical protein
MTSFIENRKMVPTPPLATRHVGWLSSSRLGAKAASAMVHIQGAFLCLARSYDFSTTLESRESSEEASGGSLVTALCESFLSR